MNRKLFFLTSLVVLLSCLSAANAGTQYKFDIAVHIGGVPVAYTDKSQQPGYSDWYTLIRWENDIQRHDGGAWHDIAGQAGLNLAMGGGDGSSAPGSVLDFSTAADDPICNTWLRTGSDGDNPGDSVCYIVLWGPGLKPGAYWIYGYHNSVGGGQPKMPRVYVETYTSANAVGNSGGAPVDPDGGGVIVPPEGNDVNVPIMHVSDDDLLEPNVSLVKFYTDGSPVKITYENGADSTAVLNAFILEVFGEGPEAKDPSPANNRTGVCPDVELSWGPGVWASDVNGHDLYLGTDFNDVNNANTAVQLGVYEGRLDDPCYDPTGYLDFGETYYWRVDEVNDVCSPGVPWKGTVWNFTTEDGKARNPAPEDGGASVESDTIAWTPSCIATLHDVYFSTDYNAVRDATTSSPMPDPYLGTVPFTNLNSGLVGVGKRYYWRVDEQGPTTFPKGDVWTYQTRGTALMHYSFDGVIDANLPSPITDDTGNVTFTKRGNGELRYDEPNPLYNTLGTSAQFTPVDGYSYGGGAAFLMRSCFGPDLLDLTTDAYTIEAWVRQDGPAANADDDDDMEGTVLRKDRYTYGFGVDNDGTVKFMHAGNVLASEPGRSISRDEWHHIAAVYDESDVSARQKLYIDGLVAADNNEPGPNPPDDFATDDLGIGAYRYESGSATHYRNQFNGAIDELRVSDYALTPNEFLMRGDEGLAWLPRPSNGRRDVPPDTELDWSPGRLASSHNLYLGTSWDDVSDANTVVTLGVFIDNMEPNEYDPCLLAMKTEWYWRVDEIDDSNDYIWRGHVWRFTTADYLALDNFEQYDTDQKAIQYTWYDQYSQNEGELTGAWLELAKVPSKPVHLGRQAMSYTYNTDDPWADLEYAEAWLPLDEIGGQQDWTVADLRILSLFFYGQPDNDACDTEQMYVSVEDIWGEYAERRYGDNQGESMSDIKVDEWQQWIIALSSFSDSNYAEVAANVDFANVRRVYIGFGDRRTPVAAGKGIVYFDDLRVSLAMCVPDQLKPAYDWSGNCIVDVADIGVMGENWLRHDVNFLDDLGIQVEEPCDANLLGHWKLDEGDGNTAGDSSANNYHGTLQGDYEWMVPGKDGNAVDFDGGRMNLDDEGNTPNLRPLNAVSVCAWAYLDGGQENARVVVKGDNDEESYELEVDGDDQFVFQFRDGNDPNNDRYDVNGMVWTDDWIHLAGTYDGSTIACYVNGELQDAKDIDNPWGLSQDPNGGFAIGDKPESDDSDGNPFDGPIDDVRVYNYGLSPAEVAWLASEGTGFVALVSEVNIFSGERPEVINFKDLAKIFEAWGEEKLWPE
ncbi:MAG TPA: LamG domain-containing protein [Sedimentisphaerales bacterium]|nr:LamG domain-containing protein [Sedimentisphaerales bacterium]